MSHPIGEAAGYYAKKDERNRNSFLPSNINTKKSKTNNNYENENDILSPDSPESRQKHKRTSKQQPEDSSFDPRLKWQRVLNKLSYNGSEDTPHLSRFSILQQHQQQEKKKERKDDDQSDSEHEEEELSFMEPRYGIPLKYSNDDATLPTPIELEQLEQKNKTYNTTNDDDNGYFPSNETERPYTITTTSGEDQIETSTIKSDNYFTHPFSPNTQVSPELTIPSPIHASTSKKSATTIPVTKPDHRFHFHYRHPSQQKMLESSTSENASNTDSENEDHPSSQGGSHLFDGRAKLHWGKTLDKIRLIANIQKPSRPLQESDIETSASLVPYCPAMFDPPFIALSKDTHGRRPVCNIY